LLTLGLTAMDSFLYYLHETSTNYYLKELCNLMINTCKNVLDEKMVNWTRRKLILFDKSSKISSFQVTCLYYFADIETHHAN
jgi:hypothetical protein